MLFQQPEELIIQLLLPVFQAAILTIIMFAAKIRQAMLILLIIQFLFPLLRPETLKLRLFQLIYQPLPSLHLKSIFLGPLQLTMWVSLAIEFTEEELK